MDPADDECDICQTEVEGFVAVPVQGESVVAEAEAVEGREPMLTVVLFLLGFAVVVAAVWVLAVGAAEQGRTLGFAGIVLAALFLAGGTVYAVRGR